MTEEQAPYIIDRSKDQIEQAFKCLNAVSDILGPEINKIRFIRDLAMSAESDFCGLTSERQRDSIEGLAAILEGVIQAYDKVCRELPL